MILPFEGRNGADHPKEAWSNDPGANPRTGAGNSGMCFAADGMPCMS
jgi:hypothetical protein